jgi:hypothetical protein
MKKLFAALILVTVLGGCYVPSGYYRVVRVDVQSTHGGTWYEESPGVHRPRHHHGVVVRKRRRPRRAPRTRMLRVCRHRHRHNHRCRR